MHGKVGWLLVAGLLVGLPLTSPDPVAGSAGNTLIKLTPAWEFPDGWAVTRWATDSHADTVVLVRGTEPITFPQPNWATRDLFVLDGATGARAIYGPESGLGTDPISRLQPDISADGRYVVFGTYRRQYPQGTDLRMWHEGMGNEVIFTSGKNFDLDFPAISSDGNSAAVVEILPLTAGNNVFRMRIHRWSAGAGPEMMVEHQQRHITGLDLSGDGQRIVYCLQNHADQPDSGQIRIIDSDGSGRLLFNYLGTAGPVAIDGDGDTVAAFLPGEPAEMGGPRDDSPGVFLWREGRAPTRLDPRDGSADSRIPLTMSPDGTRISWGGILWTADGGPTRVFPTDLQSSVSQAQMSADGYHWTVWLSEGPEGPGLYRLDLDQPLSELYLPLVVRERRPTRPPG